MGSIMQREGRVVPLALCALVGLLVLSGCSGGSDADAGATKQDGSDGDVQVSGVVRSGTDSVDGITICALGDCDTTDGDGLYELSVPRDEFAGGDVLFTLEGDDFVTDVVAQDLPGGNRDAEVDFQLLGDRAAVTDVREGAVSPDDEDDEGDSDGGDVEVRGTLRSANTTDESDVEDVTICALGDCSTTDGDGQYSLRVPEGVFEGGDVLFTFAGDNLDAQAVAPELPGNNRDAVVDFEIRGGAVVPVLVRAEGDVDDGEDGDGDVLVRGFVAGGGDSMTVCALGDCDTIDEGELYTLQVPAGIFGGGDVLFTFESDELSTETVARDLPGNDTNARVDFVARGGNVQVVRVSADIGGGGEGDGDIEDDVDEIEGDIEEELEDIEDEIQEDIDDIEDDIDDNNNFVLTR